MKKFLIIVLAVLLSFTACTNRTPIWILPPGVLYPDNEPEPEPCKHLVLTVVEEYFDANKHYPKTGVCEECGVSVTRDAIGIANADDLMNLASDINNKDNIGCTDVDILENIDMSGKEWTPIIIGNGNDSIKVLTIDGKNHTISNLSFTKSEDDTVVGAGFIGEIRGNDTTVVVKNLTILAAEFTDTTTNTSYQYAAGFVGYIDGGPTISLINCHLKTSCITSGYYAGGIYGWSGPNVSSSYNIENCTVDYCTIEGGSSVGGIVGHASNNFVTLKITSNVVTNSSITSTSNDTNKAGNIIGTINYSDVTLEDVHYSHNNVISGETSINRYVGRMAGGSLTIDDNQYSDVQ